MLLREQDNVSGEAATNHFAYSLEHIHQHNAPSRMVLNPTTMLSQYQQPFEVDDNVGGARYFSVPTQLGGFVAPSMVQQPVAYQATIAAAANYSLQQPQNQNLIVTSDSSRNFHPGYVLPQTSSAARHQSPMMMPPGGFSHGYAQLQPLVQQQQQLMIQQQLMMQQQQQQLMMMQQQLVQQQQQLEQQQRWQLTVGRVNSIHTGSVSEQQRQPADAVRGRIPVETAAQLHPHQCPQQASSTTNNTLPVQSDYALFDVPDASRERALSTMHYSAATPNSMEESDGVRR